MKQTHRLVILFTGICLLMLWGYKYSLLHDVSQLAYLSQPETVPPFTLFMTYVLMCIGILPTILVMTLTSFLCQTTYPAGTVLYTCFGNPFAIEQTSGYIAYVTASLVSSIALYYVTALIIRSQKSHE